MRLQLKRMIGVLTLAATAAMLVAAMGATSAYAKPEFKTNGSFPVSFLGEGLGKATFLSEKLNSVTCNDSHSKGEVLSSTDATVTITYLGDCLLKGSLNNSCPTITTNELLLTPLSNLNGGTKLGVLVLPKTGTEIAKFTCEGNEIKVKGGVICEGTPGGKLVTSSKTVCKEGTTHGSQEFTSGEGPTGAIFTTSLTAESTVIFFKITEKDAQTTTEDVTYTKEVEQVH